MNRSTRRMFRFACFCFVLVATGAQGAAPDPPLTDHPTWTSGPTSRSSWTWEEMKATLTFRLPAGYESLPKVDMSLGMKGGALPEKWDWRDHEGVTPVKDQGNCGSCWAFASVGALEGCARILDRVVYDLSEQQVLSCNTLGQGCGGGYWEAPFEVFSTYGAIEEQCMPYRAIDSIPCTEDACPPSVTAAELIYLEPRVESIKAACYLYGPVTVAMMVFDDFMGYSGGCYVHGPARDVNHAVVVVGWDDTLCGGAWIVKNSWGEDWGERGYFHIRYGSADIGTGACVFRPNPGRVISIHPLTLESTRDGSLPFMVRAQVSSLASTAINPDSVRLHYRVNGGGWNCVPMAPEETSGQWAGQIPPQEKPATIEYYFRADDVEDRHAIAPWEAPDSLYAFDVALELDAFEDQSGGWMVGSPDDHATSGLWECVDPIGTEAQPEDDHSARGRCCWVTGQHNSGRDPGFNDVDGGRTTLTSPGYVLTGSQTAILKYFRWFSNNMGQAPSEDPWIAQVRNNGGPWIDIENTTAARNAWVEVSADLLQIFGPELGLVQLRFIARDLGAPSCVEAAVDDLVILAEQPEVSAIRTLDAASGGLAVDPNPSSAGTVLRFALQKEGPVNLSIFAPSGRLVRKVADGTMSPGRHEVAWDGRDAAGRIVPSGAYYWAFEQGGSRRTGSLLIVR